MVEDETNTLISATERADSLKKQGNDQFTSGEYQQALTLYQEAITLCPTKAVYYANASACCSNLGEFGSAAVYATEAIRRDPTMAKAYYRRAAAMMGLREWKAALEDLRHLLGGKALSTTPSALDTTSVPTDVKSKIQICERELQKIAFAKAIHVDVMELDMRHIRKIEVDTAYKGPRLEDDKPVTWEFVQQLIAWFKSDKRLASHYAYRLMYEALRLFQMAPNVVSVTTPSEGQLTICGDVHGQFFDFIHIFETNGFPSLNHTYIFNGDLVDRGPYSIEILLVAFALKTVYPNNFFIARGNHETESINRMHGFYEEVGKKYSTDQRMYSLFNQVLHNLPLAHLVDKSHFVVHGGLPAGGATLTIDDIQAVERCKVPETGSLVAHLLWSDPQDNTGVAPSYRGEGILFGPDITEAFLKHNGLHTIIRSHVWEPTGYKVHHDGKCITIFSAPNYTEAASPAALINIRPGQALQFKTFEAAPYRGKAPKPHPPTGLPFY